MNLYHIFTSKLSSFGYFDENLDCLTQAKLESVLTAKQLEGLNADSLSLEVFEDIVRYLTQNNIVKPYYTNEDYRLVAQTLRERLAYLGNSLMSADSSLTRRLKNYHPAFIEAKKDFVTLGELSAKMYKVVDKVIEDLVGGDPYQHESFNKQLALEECKRYAKPHKELETIKLLSIRNNIRALEVAPTSVLKEANMTDALISETNLEAGYFILTVSVNGKPHKIIYTAYNAMNITTGNYIGGGIILPSNTQFDICLEGVKTNEFLKRYSKELYYRDARLPVISRNDEFTMKRAVRMVDMAKLLPTKLRCQVRHTDYGVIHMKTQKAHLVMYPHYAYDMASGQIIFVNTCQDKPLTEVLPQIKLGLQALLTLSAQEKEAVLKLYSIGYDLRRKITL